MLQVNKLPSTALSCDLNADSAGAVFLIINLGCVPVDGLKGNIRRSQVGESWNSGTCKWRRHLERKDSFCLLHCGNCEQTCSLSSSPEGTYAVSMISQCLLTIKGTNSSLGVVFVAPDLALVCTMHSTLTLPR
jgi:hypothetical protein